MIITINTLKCVEGGSLVLYRNDCRIVGSWSVTDAPCEVQCVQNTHEVEGIAYFKGVWFCALVWIIFLRFYSLNEFYHFQKRRRVRKWRLNIIRLMIKFFFNNRYVRNIFAKYSFVNETNCPMENSTGALFFATMINIVFWSGVRWKNISGSCWKNSGAYRTSALNENSVLSTQKRLIYRDCYFQRIKKGFSVPARLIHDLHTCG